MIPDINEVLTHYPEFTGIHPACLAVPMMDEESFAEFTKDIMTKGLKRPIVRMKTGELLDGRTRLLACYVAGVEIRTEQFDSVDDPWDFVRSENIERRHLTIGQKAAFAYERKRYEAELAKERMSAGGKAAQGVEDFPPLQENKGKARDKAGASVGVSGRNVDKYGVVAETIPDLAKQVKAGEIALDAAYKEANKERKSRSSQPVERPTPRTNKPEPSTAEPKPLVLRSEPATRPDTVRIVTVSGKTKDLPAPKGVRFNQTNDSVDWANWTWNPVTGCEHGCAFCYARAIAHSERMQAVYPFQFEPTFHEYRLTAPRQTQTPQSDDDRDGRVFVCSMADLFGKWVPDEWIRKVFDACLESPQWEYLFLTKWPARYAKMPLIPKAWYGASVIQQSDVSRVEKSMTAFECDNALKWVSLEPMQERIVFNDISWCDLLVIGSQTSTTQPTGFVPAFAPEFDWVVDVVNQCREAGVPYYLKANLGMEAPGMKLPKNSPRK